MRKIFTLSILLLFVINSNAQSNLEDYVKKFFLDFPKNSNKSIDEIYSTNPYTSGLTEAISNMKKVAENYPNSLGNYYGYEVITQKKCTNNFILYTYLVRYDRQPMKFTFEFYKPNDKWMLYSLNFAATIDEDVEQAAKNYESKN